MSGIPTLRTDANAKFNLCLLLGPQRSDGYHEVATVIVPVDLTDTVTLTASSSSADEVICPGVDGDNLALKALQLFRSHSGWSGPPVQIEIKKRIPVAAGMAGGSADAAAALRLIAAASGVDADQSVARAVAPLLGADVPAMLDGRTVLATGTGTRLQPLAQPAEFGVLVLPAAGGLSTPEVFKRAGELELRRPANEIAEAAQAVSDAGQVTGWMLGPQLAGVNDLGAAARSLSAEIDSAITAALAAGADLAFVTGSGPTVIGLFVGADGISRAQAAAPAITEQHPERPAPIVCSTSSQSATIEVVK
jgi:4-diphosphocytidyl-2-C-methyl-D-erythritol kinase